MSGKLISYEQLMLDTEFYRAIGKKYKLERSGSSLAVFAANGVKYFCSTVNEGRTSTNLPSNKLWFIMKVKRYIEKNDLINTIKPNYKKQSEISYIAMSDKVGEGEHFKTPYSVDIKGAYWEAAYKGGWLSHPLYLEGLDMDKRIRLASLGSFAKRIYQYEFNGKVEKMVNVKEPMFPHVFFNQAKTIFRVMEACREAAGDDFLFYWTDGIYVKNKRAAKLCEKKLMELGYQYKTESLVSITRLSNGFQTVEDKLKKDGKFKRSEKMYRSNIE